MKKANNLIIFLIVIFLLITGYFVYDKYFQVQQNEQILEYSKITYVESPIEDIKFESSEIIKVGIKRGEIISQPIKFFNSGSTRTFNFNKISNQDFFELSDDKLIVEEESFGVLDVLLGKPNLETGVYFGSVYIEGEKNYLSIPISLTVNSKDQLFGSAIRINQNSLTVRDFLNFEVILYNLKAISPSALVEYKIFDLEGNLLLTEEEIVNIRKEVKVSKEFLIPEDTENGPLTLVVSVKQGDSFYASSESFDLSTISLGPALVEKDYSLPIFLSIILFLFLFVFVLSYYWNHRVLLEAKDWRKQIGEVKKIKFSDAGRYMRKLIHQKNILERAYASRYISRSSYNQGIREINILITKTKKKL